MGDLFSPAGRDLILCLRRILRLRAASHAARLGRVISRMEDPRRGALYLGGWLRRLPPEAVVSVLDALLENAERREPGSEIALEAILCPEMRKGWDEDLSRRVRSLARAEKRFDLAAMLMELPAADPRFDPGAGKLPKGLRDLPLGVRKSMARRQDINLMERLLSDPDEAVIANLLDNPRLTLQEVIGLAARREAREEVLEALAVHPRWIPRYRVKVALAFNPATPVRIALGLLHLLMATDLGELGRDGRVSSVVSRRAGEVLKARLERRLKEGPLVILHIPHASRRIPDEVMEGITLSREGLVKELLALTDAFVDEIFDLRRPLAARVVFPWSRCVVDPERFEDPAAEPMEEAGMGAVYTRTSGGEPLREEPGEEERRRLLDAYYRPHHRRLEAAVDRALEAHRRCLIVDCHSFPSAPLPCDLDREPGRPDVCIGTDPFHTPPALAAWAVGWFASAGYTVRENRPYGGTMVPLKHLGRDGRVSSVMVELNRSLYMDEGTGLRLPQFERIAAETRGFLSLLAERYERGGFDRS